MPEIRKALFGKTKALERQIDEFLDKVSQGGMVYAQAVIHFLEAGRDTALEEKYAEIEALENRGDQLRREIETTLYTEMLIPDARGDVLGLLDDLDHLLDVMKKHVASLVIEDPALPADLTGDFRELVEAVVASVESTVLASRAYFRDPRSVGDHIHKIGFHESASDRIAMRLARRIFDSDMELYRKMYLRNGVVAIDRIADEAEDAGDRLAIYAVKRSL